MQTTLMQTGIGEVEYEADYRLVNPRNSETVYELIFIVATRKTDGKKVVAFCSTIDGTKTDPFMTLKEAFYNRPDVVSSSTNELLMKHWVASNLVDKFIARERIINGTAETYWFDADIMRNLWERITNTYNWNGWRLDDAFIS